MSPKDLAPEWQGSAILACRAFHALWHPHWRAPCTEGRVLTHSRVLMRSLILALFAVSCRKEASSRSSHARVPRSGPVASHEQTAPRASVAPAPRVITSSRFSFARAPCKAPESAERFFPPGSLWPGEQRVEDDELFRSWYSQILFRMAEPSLSCGRFVPQTYRFVVVPTWGPPAAVRITVTAAPRLSAVVLSGQGGYDPGRPKAVAARFLGNAERDELLDAISRADFWNLPAQDLGHRGMDGSEWLVEARVGDRYHVVNRWSPTEGAYHALCLAFARLGGVPTP